MFRKILVPLDGSQEAERVLPHVLALARSMEAEIVLLRVPLYAYAHEAFHNGAGGHGRAPQPVPRDREAALTESRNYLNKMRNNLIRLGFRISVVVAEGEAAARIIAYTQAAQVDLIAMATHARTGVGRLLYGSVTDEVMRRSGKPVLCVRID